ncbi:hypothetical protein, partial [Reyranella sp.]|uniref:hypothetical protein n=1 Tax=Reyranella sp. TaxID=1929291 RepID=UPI003D0DD53E
TSSIMGTSSNQRRASSNPRGLIYEPKKIRPVDRRISFRDLAKLAQPRKTIEYLVERGGCDRSTAKRWLSGASPASGRAVGAVVADIMSRLR